MERDLTSEESTAGSPSARAPSKDAWSRALDSLEMEFASELLSERARPRPATVPPPPAAPSHTGGEEGSGAHAFVRAQALEEEVGRLRAELQAQEEAFGLYQDLMESDRDPSHRSSGGPARAPDGIERARLRTLESSLEDARRDGLAREMVVEQLRSQLQDLQEELRLARSSIANAVIPAEAPPTEGRVPGEQGARAELHPADPPASGAAGAGSTHTSVVVRHRAPAGGEAEEPNFSAPVELYGPNDVQLASVPFALGEGQALELFLSTLVIQWKSLGHPFDARVAPDGIHVSLVGDPENRRLSVLTSGRYVVHLGSLGAERVAKMVASMTAARKGARS